MFVNQRGMVLEIQNNKDFEGANVIAWKRHNGNNQKWNVVYTDQDQKIVTEGLDKYYGLYWNRPFYMFADTTNSGKVIEVTGGRNLNIRKWVSKNTA